MGNQNDSTARSESPDYSSEEPMSEYTSFESTDVDGCSDCSPISAAPSVMSLSESLYKNSFRQVFDRLVNNYSDLYHLPADEEELQRLDMQHLMFTAAMGPLPGMDAILADDGSPKAALDLGCGSGSWLYDVANEHPHCRTVGVDLVPVSRRDLPPNCRTEVDDINLGLEHFNDQFDVVHARLISLGIKDYAGLVDQVSRAVRSRGVISFTESDYRAYDGNKNLITVEEGKDGQPRSVSAIAVLYHYIVKSVRARGANIDAAALLHRWIGQHSAYEDVEYREFWLPTGPFIDPDAEDAHRLNFIGELLRQDLRIFLKSIRVLLLSGGMPEAQVDELRARAWRELERMEPPIWAKVCVGDAICARSTQAEKLSSSTSTELSLTFMGESRSLVDTAV
ncbi:S-adenosyl-L-methionine-dependent methyltransferase [Auricularia subglabra TFB-10046 SS5]|nr:S-adenosyl-L-methionine-dependent methyltransferase [Auricularia subglabra TFB-10046 SS5]